MEYLFNGSGDSEVLERGFARLGTGGTFHASRHVLGFVGTYEILPILLGQFATLASLDDGSLQLQPGVTWSADNNVDILLGGIISVGERPLTATSLTAGQATSTTLLRSEFGTFPHFFYVELKAYF